MKILHLLIMILLPTATFSQYTEIINSNLPGNSQSAYAVGARVLQFEGGLWYERNNHKEQHTEMHFTGVNYAVRYGFFREQLEVMLNGTLAYDKTLSNGVISSHFGFVNNTIGAKYLLFKPAFLDEKPNVHSWKANNSFRWRNLTPSISLYAGMNFLPNSRYYYEDIARISPKVVAIFQAEPIPRVVAVLNLVGDRLTERKNSEYSYLFTITHNLDNGWFSIFAEQQGVYSDRYRDQITRLGVAFLLSDKIQLNADMGFGWKDTPQRYMGLIGASYRIDNHNSYIKKVLKEKVKPTKIEHKKKAKRNRRNAIDLD
nr:transporter [uncultured Capnocytophaga sp.]